MGEKNGLEKAALTIFLETYNYIKGTNLELRKHRDKPDFIVINSESNQEIGIEVAHLYYDKNEAKILSGRSTNTTHSLMKSYELVTPLNKLLREKARKAPKYNYGGKMFLVIRVASQIFNKQDFENYKQDIIVPPNIFNEIWLVFGTISGKVPKGLMNLK